MATDWTAAAGSKLAAKLNESSSTATDSTSNGNTGTVNGTTRPVAAIVGSGYLFTIASADSINFGHGASINDLAGTGISVCFWAKLDAISSTVNQRYWQKGNTGFFLISTAGGTPYNLYFGVDFSVTDGLWHWATAVVDQGWHHYALVYNGSSSSNTPTLYTDGVSQALSTDTAPSGSFSTDAASDLIVGNVTAAGTRPLGGTMDEFLMYSGILTSANITEIMNNGLDGTRSKISNLAGGGAAARGAYKNPLLRSTKSRLFLK